jgi:hypothetical protein
MVVFTIEAKRMIYIYIRKESSKMHFRSYEMLTFITMYTFVGRCLEVKDNKKGYKIKWKKIFFWKEKDL